MKLKLFSNFNSEENFDSRSLNVAKRSDPYVYYLFDNNNITLRFDKILFNFLCNSFLFIFLLKE